MIGRFMSKVRNDPATGCWLWTGRPRHNGYGEFHYQGKTRRAHHVAWLLWRGGIPSGLVVRHGCDVRNCVNPDHLKLGTVADNQRDMVVRGRSKKGRPSEVPGEKNGNTHLTNDDVATMKSLLRSGVSAPKVARQFHISETQAKRIRSGEAWKHIP